MKSILIASFILTTSLLIAPNVHAFSGHNASKFERQLNAANQYPNQFSAAIRWRLSNRHVDLRKQPRALIKFGWHPSIVAVISSPILFEHAISQRSYARNQWSGKGQSRNNFNKRNRNIRR